ITRRSANDSENAGAVDWLVAENSLSAELLWEITSGLACILCARCRHWFTARALQPRRSRFVRRLPAVGAVDFHLSGINSIAASGENRVELGTTKREIRNLAVGRGDDAVHTAGLIANLQPQPRGDV